MRAGSAMVVTPTRRERQRAATLDEIKAVARSLMRQHGRHDLRFTNIAQQMGMSAPALYNYFADRDALIAALTADAYRQLAAEVATAGEACAGDDVGARWLAMATAYRGWARREPEQFGLVFGPPVPRPERLGAPATQDAAPDAAAQLTAFFVRGDLLPAASFHAMVQAWATVHGFTCLEACHHLDWLSDQAREQLFSATVRAAALAAGIPAQDGGPSSR